MMLRVFCHVLGYILFLNLKLSIDKKSAHLKQPFCVTKAFWTSLWCVKCCARQTSLWDRCNIVALFYVRLETFGTLDNGTMSIGHAKYICMSECIARWSQGALNYHEHFVINLPLYVALLCDSFYVIAFVLPCDNKRLCCVVTTACKR
jgi:hypothetical protein